MIGREYALNSSLFTIKTKTLDGNTTSKKAVFLTQQKIIHAPGWWLLAVYTKFTWEFRLCRTELFQV